MAIVTWAVCTPRRLAWAALGIAIASSDRVAGVALLVALAVILWLRRDQTSPRRAALLVTSSLAGVVAVLGYAAISAGNPVAFLTARSGWRGTGGVGYIPYTVRHGVASTLRLVADEVTVSPVPDNGAPDITERAPA